MGKNCCYVPDKTVREGEVIKEEPNGDWTITTKDGVYLRGKVEDVYLRIPPRGKMELHSLKHCCIRIETTNGEIFQQVIWECGLQLNT